MAVFQGSFYAESLGMQTLLTVILPQNLSQKDGEGRFPVLFLLHGLSDNAQSWMQNTMIARYAEAAGLAVVMPEVQRSFYTDMAEGQRYFTYVAEELPRLARELFPLTRDPARTYVAGLSMGGYGALKLALHHPERYGAAGCFSGAVDLLGRLGEVTGNPGEAAAITGGSVLPENNLFLLTAQAAKQHVSLPPLYMTCGLSDFMYDDQKRFRQQLDFLKIPYVYEEWPGGHDWDVWNRSVLQFIRFIGY